MIFSSGSKVCLGTRTGFGIGSHSSSPTSMSETPWTACGLCSKWVQSLLDVSAIAKSESACVNPAASILLSSSPFCDLGAIGIIGFEKRHSLYLNQPRTEEPNELC